MKVLISGASGFIGSKLVRRLEDSGQEVWRLARKPAGQRHREVKWRPHEPLDPKILGDFDAVVHLAGKTVSGRWTEEARREIRESRIEPTARLAQSIAAAARQFGRPRVFISASATGYYGSRADEELTEASAPGNGFLPGICIDWENATRAASDAGVRVVTPRIGLVLGTDGGALAKMLPIFRLGIAGKIGSGKQWWSWITVNDVIRLFEWALTNDSVSGPVNVVAPGTVPNEVFTKTLGRVLGRPTLFTMPTFAAKLAMGAAADELVLASAKVVPEVATRNGFTFADPDLEPALRKLLKK